MRGNRPSVWMAAIATWLLALPPGAWAQDGDAGPAARATALDVGMLLDAAAVQPATVQDPAWSLGPQTGRKLLALPVRLLRVTQTTELDRPAFTVRGGRFLCWQVPTQQSQMFAGSDYGMGDEMAGYSAPAAYGAAGAQTAALPEGAPRIARRITLTPDGMVHWELDRALAGAPGATADANSLFALKVRPDLMQSREPQRPGAGAAAAPGSPPGGNAEQRRAEQAAYREQVAAFNALREQVRSLPDRFSQPAPPFVVAIFEVGTEVNELGLGGDAPLPWRIGFADLTALSGMSRQGAHGPGQLDAQTLASVNQLAQLARDNHPLTHRLIATVIQRSNLAAAAAPGDAVYRLVGQVLAGPDAEARRTVLAALSAVSPQTPGSVALLQDAARTMPPALKADAIAGLMGGNFASPQEAAAMAGVLQSALNDPQGADAGDLLLRTAERVGDNPEAVNALGNLDFSRLAAERLDDAIAAVIVSAPTHPLAAAWLDRGLLGAFNPSIPARTLQRIVEADAGPSPARTLMTALTRLVLRPAEQDRASDALRLAGPLPIASPRHSLVNLLSSGDEQTRELAWRALIAFTVNPPRMDPNDPRAWQQPVLQPGQVSPAAETIDRILSAAQSQPQTPPTLAPFLARQQDPRATAALVQLLVSGSDPAAGQAATGLLGSGRAVDAALLSLVPADRTTAGRRFYEHVRGGAQPVTQLLRHPDDTVARWFGAQVAAGRTPQANEWAQSLTESQLLQAAASPDAELAAGAVSALVFAAGGDRIAADAQVQRFAAQTDRTEQGMAAAWASARKDIFTRRLSDAAGLYAVTLHVYPSGGAAPQAYGGSPRGPGGVMIPTPNYAMPEEEYYDEGYDGGAYSQVVVPAAAPAQTHRLAVVELIADGNSVSLRNATVGISVPESVFAIRLNNAGELKNFPVPALETLDLQSIAQPIDLLPQADGSWKGAGQMRDGGTVEVVLEPVSAEP